MKRKKGKNHGFSNTRLYTTWCGMKARCNNPNEKVYKYYGGKGIKLATEWENDFLQFRQWALQNGYSDNLTIERIDVSGNYCPENCKWITKIEQQKNKTTTLYYEYMGFILKLKEWAMIYDIDYQTLYRRIYGGWDFEKALLTPIASNKINKRYKKEV